MFRLIPGTGWLNVTKRVALDQFLFAPVFLSTFISSNLILMGTPEQVCNPIALSIAEADQCLVSRLFRN